MSAADVLVQAHAAGVELLIYEGKLASRGPATPELRDAIRAHKPALVALLSGKRERWPELPDDDEHARWLRGEISFAPPVAWIEREDVRLVVEDFFRERWHPDRIARPLGLTKVEVRGMLGR